MNKASSSCRLDADEPLSRGLPADRGRNGMIRVLTALIYLTLSIGADIFWADVAEAQTITLRGATSSSSRITPLAFVGAGGGQNGTGTISPSYPGGWAVDDILICIVESKDNIIPTMPAGWTLLNTASNGASHQASLFWRRGRRRAERARALVAASSSAVFLSDSAATAYASSPRRWRDSLIASGEPTARARCSASRAIADAGSADVVSAPASAPLSSRDRCVTASSAMTASRRMRSARFMSSSNLLNFVLPDRPERGGRPRLLEAYWCRP